MKKNLIIILVIFLILIITIGIIYAMPSIKEKLFWKKLNKIEYDVKIEKKTDFVESTGGTSVSYKLINLDECKLYDVSFSEIYTKRPDINWKIIEKKLTQEQIQQISKLLNMESEKIEKKDESGELITFNYYWTIEYNGKTIELNELPFSEEILKIK